MLSRSLVFLALCFSAPFLVAKKPQSLLPGGEATTFVTGQHAFGQPSANMSKLRQLDFSVGNSFFRNPWVLSPATTTARDGLGPFFNTNGCQNCHVNDGRGHPPEFNDINAVSLLVRLSIPATADNQHLLLTQGVIPEPNYGGQLQDFAHPSAKPEGQVTIHYEEFPVTFADGEVIFLRRPEVFIDQLNYGPLHPETQMSVRIAPPMIGLGLLEAIAEKDILKLADPMDKNGDGISGRPNQVWDVEKKQTVLGRFGWKAGQPNLMQQNAAAFNGDLGLTSSLFPAENCSPAQSATVCLRYPNGGYPEVPDKVLKFVEFYTQNLGVPARTLQQANAVTTNGKTGKIEVAKIKKGESLFAQLNCAGCHVPSFKTRKLKKQPEQSKQWIFPYTDLLLHDMGEGLADHRPEFIATGREWRTPPLWGIGKTEMVTGHTYFLHDGRARNLTEAILWHGGEAEAAKQAFMALTKTDREAVITFLQSL